MTYDWEGTRTRRIRKIKLAITLTVPLFVLCLSAANYGV